jgi:DNA polymerase III subunit delta
MTVIKHNEVHKHLKPYTQDKTSVPYPVFLLYGEEVLTKTALQTVLSLLMPGADRQYSYDTLEGYPENILEAIQRLNTYAMLDSGKVVALMDSTLFSAKQKGTASADNAKTVRTSSGDAADMLISALEETFPANHYLVVTTAAVDKRKKLYKVMETTGLVIDCSVPQGDRQADKVAQDAVLRESMQTLLSERNKSLESSAYAALCGLTGFDLRTFLNNLNKLMDYVGDRKKITVEDVSFVLERTKQDPIYAFTNALTDKDVGNAFFYMDSLLSNGYHELQLIAAAVNQVRRLVVLREFVDGTAGGVWRAGMPYNAFRDQVMPMIQSHDKALKEQVSDWDRSLANLEGDGAGQKKRQTGTDLLIAPNPKNAYPVYKMLQKTVKFQVAELLEAMKILSRADGRLKSSGQPPRSILADAVLKICSAA